MLAPVAATLLAGAGAVAAAAAPSSHNPHHAHRAIAERAITNDASSIEGRTFDFIIAGGGVAGLTIASRLSEWSNQTVLVIEAGGDGSDVIDQIITPGFSYLNSLTDSPYDWSYDTIPQADALNLTKAWPRGKGLGGSGAINGMYWNRGNRENYDAWNTLNPGATEDWGWDEVNRCIMKAENYTAPRQDQISQHSMQVEPDAHGQSGPIQAGFAQYMFDIVENWIPSMRAVGINPIDGGSGTTHGAYFCPITINTSNMTRSDSKAGYIDPLPPRDNLMILTGQQVTAINFNGSTDANNNIIASGVTFQASSGAQSYTVNANREVILAGGTVGSPQILQLSGIGPAERLSALGIESRIDLPVGYNLQDHITATVEFSTPSGTLTWNNLSAPDRTLWNSELTKYQNDRTGMWTFVNQAVAFPNMADLLGGSAANYASLVQRDLNQTWQNAVEWKSLPANVGRGLAAQYQIQASHIDSEVGQVEMLMHLLAPNNNVAIQASLQHPWSRGTIFITSTSAFTSPAINPDYFSLGYDIDILNNGVQLARRIAAAAPMNTLCITETNPGTSFAGGSTQLDDWIRDDIGTTYHPIGTCSMLPRDDGGVVDTQLIVYGSANIRVIDSSIIPLHMSAHTMGTTYGVAEKGSEIIKRRYYEVQESSSTSASEGGAGGASRTSSGSGSSNTAAAGGAGVSSDSGLSNAAKIGVGIGAGVGAAALLAAIIAFCCIRRKKQKRAPTDAAWYKGAGAGAAGAGAGQQYDQVPKERDGDYPMANFTPPQAGYAQHGRTPSVSTMATADLASRDPMMASRRASSGFGFDNYGYDHSGQATPAERFDDGGYPTQPPSGAWSPAHQKYTQVQI